MLKFKIQNFFTSVFSVYFYFTWIIDYLTIRWIQKRATDGRSAAKIITALYHKYKFNSSSCIYIQFHFHFIVINCRVECHRQLTLRNITEEWLCYRYNNASLTGSSRRQLRSANCPLCYVNKRKFLVIRLKSGDVFKVTLMVILLH